ncbi:unnamed protein product [Alopecurus aequalis]
MDDDADPTPPVAVAASTSPSPSSSASPSPRSKRRRTDRYALGFEFAPRPAPSAPAPTQRSTPEWTEDSTFALLDAWGERFVCAGRRSLSADEWLEVSRLAAAADSRPAGYFSESQCRNRIDTLRKMFRKEKERSRLAAHRSSNPSPSKWVYFNKMLSLMCPPPPQPPQSLLAPIVKRRRDTHPVPRHSWGVDVGEFVLAGCSTAAPGNSGPDAELGEDQKYEPGVVKGKEFAVLREAIRRFGEVYERVESSKRQHMAELKRMRRDMQRDLEVRWREILERAQMEIVSLEEENDTEEEGDDNKRLGDYNGVEMQNNGAVDASP